MTHMSTLSRHASLQILYIIMSMAETDFQIHHMTLNQNKWKIL